MNDTQRKLVEDALFVAKEHRRGAMISDQGLDTLAKAVVFLSNEVVEAQNALVNMAARVMLAPIPKPNGKAKR